MKRYEADIIVAGGGPAGTAAAIAAARNGRSVLLVEQTGQLGGMSTNGGVHPWMTFHDKSGRQVIYGIGQEIVEELVKSGNSRGHVGDTMGETSTVTPFDPEALKELLLRMCVDAGVRLLLHSAIYGVVTENGRITALKAANKNGEVLLVGKQFVDATGDADVAAFAGCPYEKGRREDGMMQPATMNFTMAGVDFEAIRRHMRAHPEDFHSNTHFDWLDTELPNCVSGFFEEWNRGCREMGLQIKRDRILCFRGFRDDIATVNTTRVIGVDSTDADALTIAELEGRKQAMQVARLLKDYVPGFENAWLMGTGNVIGIRESRRIVGRYQLDKSDLMEGRIPEDSIGLNAYTIDVHQPDGASFTQFEVPAYGIPYRALLPEGIHNLVVAGRSISCTREAQGSIRTTPACFVMGQGAGTACAMALQDGCDAADLDGRKLRKLLAEQGVYFGQ